jgi:hypothetical protein
MTFHFAWVNSSQTTFTNAMKREDEEVLGFEINHDEGDFATLRLEIRNPRIGLLNVGRKRWGWFAVDGTPLFFGRLVGLPDEINDDLVSLTFVARPLDYQTKKSAVAATMKEVEYFDPLFISLDRQAEPDSVLEARPKVWCIDRVTHAITASHITLGEDGTIDFGGSMYEDSVRCSFAGSPQQKVVITATVSWNQYGVGVIRHKWGSIKTYTGDGLLADWPKAGQKVGAGWTVKASKAKDKWSSLNNVNIGTDEETSYRLYYYNITGWVDFQYDAEREYKEVATFTMSSNVQEILTETGDEEPITLAVNGEADAPVDAGATIPIGDLRRRAYFSTERGNKSVAYLANIAASKLLASARCVEVSFDLPFSFAADLSLRKSGRIEDARLPGGEATGKIKSYSISGDGETGSFGCSVKLACSPGYGGVASTDDGTPSYVADGYVSNYQTMVGATTTIITDPDTGQPAMTIVNFDQTVINDDGLDLFNMTADNCTLYRHVFNEQHDQSGFVFQDATDTHDALGKNYTYIQIRLKPVNGGPFETPYTITCSDLTIPKTIDLEAPSA